MASTGTAFFPSTTSYPNTTQYPGQGPVPIFRARYSTDNVSVSTPTWTEVTASDLRAFNVSRGRESELSEFDAGTGSVLLDNRDRNFDPNFNALICPLNRWWLYEEFSGEVHDLLKGYAESYDNSWPDWGGSDAECLVSIVDEFKVLSLDGLETTDPPRSSYEELVGFDKPTGFWRMNDDASISLQIPSSTEPDSEPPGEEEDSPNPVNPKGLRKAFPRSKIRRRFPKL